VAAAIIGISSYSWNRSVEGAGEAVSTAATVIAVTAIDNIASLLI
jgi:hypothetical protein